MYISSLFISSDLLNRLVVLLPRSAVFPTPPAIMADEERRPLLNEGTSTDGSSSHADRPIRPFELSSESTPLLVRRDDGDIVAYGTAPRATKSSCKIKSCTVASPGKHEDIPNSSRSESDRGDGRRSMAGLSEPAVRITTYRKHSESTRVTTLLVNESGVADNRCRRHSRETCDEDCWCFKTVHLRPPSVIRCGFGELGCGGATS